MHNFEKLLFWQKSMVLAKDLYLLTLEINKDEKFGLISQMKRAAVSIPSNIAEGSARKSNKEFGHFLDISLGSAFELQTQLILTKELGLVNDEKVSAILVNLSEIQKMIFTFKNNLK